MFLLYLSLKVVLYFFRSVFRTKFNDPSDFSTDETDPGISSVLKLLVRLTHPHSKFKPIPEKYQLLSSKAFPRLFIVKTLPGDSSSSRWPKNLRQSESIWGPPTPVWEFSNTERSRSSPTIRYLFALQSPWPHEGWLTPDSAPFLKHSCVPRKLM